ncbi:MAG: helix-turn-helix domain-containing protein [Clostridia bacterium]|nr:helix-turn-helix domain-containing protein [Clostridia bacterium]
MNLNIGGVIRRLRAEKGITQEELADVLGVGFQAVSKWECGTTTPDIALLPEIALYFGVSMDTLFSMDEDDYLKRISCMIRDEHTITPENFVWAERYLLGVLSEDKHRTDARSLLIELYAHRENRDTLAQGRLAEEGILLDPMNVNLNAKLLRVREKRQEYDRLIRFWEPLAAKHPKNYVIIENLLTVYIHERQFDKARELIAKSEPRPFYRLCLGDMKLAAGSEEGARNIWLNTAQEFASDAWTLLQCGERMEKIGEYDTAVRLYEESYEKSRAPKQMDALYALAFLYEKMNRPDDAAGMWEKIIRSLDTDYGITSGECVDWAQREFARLKSLS